MVIAEYLAEAPYRFSIAFGREKFEDFWDATAENARILTERRKWLAQDEAKYLAVLPEAEELLDEAMELGRTSWTLGVTKREEARREPRPTQTARFLGENWEPDFLVLKREPGAVRLVAGCVCFPSSWSLDEKIGKPIEAIHEVVPALNASIGTQIRTFLERIKPGVSWTRNNWGLSRSAEWNQHPTRGTPRLDQTVHLDEVFFRVEEQSLVALPKSSGILFGIRLKVIPLKGYEESSEGFNLAELLESMSEPMAQYKGLSQARGQIARLLRGAHEETRNL
jgi:dimethylamine monooxygenase subunit A